MKKWTFKTGGIHVPEMKEKLMGEVVRTMPLPMQVAIPLKQSIGLPSVPIVKKGDKVTRGEKIAEAQGRVSSPLHASISGTVTDIKEVTNLHGFPEKAIIITADAADHAADMEALESLRTPHDCSCLSPEEIVGMIADSGVVGLGGATFPTAVKLTPPAGQRPDVLIINGAECEPSLTCDAALMCEYTGEVMAGIALLRRAAKVRRVIIGIEDNKPNAIARMTEEAAKFEGIEVCAMRTKYPQGGEKQLIYTLTGKMVPSGALPIDVGCIVQNVGTAYAVYMAVALHRPLIERVVTIGRIGNFIVPVGANLGDVIAYAEECSGAKVPSDGVWDVVIGGPMMGRSAVCLDAPVIKGTCGVTYCRPLGFDPQPCLRCGECVRACPMGLEPYLLSNYGHRLMLDEASAAGAMDCIECGSCNYSCPSARPILDYIKHAKSGIRLRKK